MITRDEIQARDRRENHESRSCARQMLDQQHLVADFAVDHFVNELPDEQNAESAGSQTHLRAVIQVRERIEGLLKGGGGNVLMPPPKDAD